MCKRTSFEFLAFEAPLTLLVFVRSWRLVVRRVIPFLTPFACVFILLLK